MTSIGPELALRLKPSVVYFSFAIICLFGAGFALAILPETKGLKPDLEVSVGTKAVNDQHGKDNLAYESHSDETHV